MNRWWSGWSNTAIDDYLMLLGSNKRSAAALELFEQCTPPIFWRAFVGWWSCFDDTWMYRDRLLILLRKHATLALVFDRDESRATFDALPDLIRVYRGCSAARVAGLAWTLSQDVAAGFARGHRGIAVPDPVVAEANIPKRAVFALIADREENEIVLDPDYLSIIRVDSF
jgi:hypothetical protein